MPTDEELERLKKLVSQVQQSPEKELSNSDKVLFYMRQTLTVLREGKPEERNELARRYAVTITEMEKVFAYFCTYIAGNDNLG